MTSGFGSGLPAALLASALGSSLSISVLIWVLPKIGITDVPNSRSSHSIPVPRGGGIGIAVGILFGTLAYHSGVTHDWVTVLVTSLAFALVGLIDDIRSLGALPRLCAQVLITVAFFGYMRDEFSEVPLATRILAPTLLLVLVNSMNFMDGINGITGMCSVVFFAQLALIGSHVGQSWITVLSLICLASCALFLPRNVPNARIFAGDSGAYLIGALVGGLSALSLYWGADPILVLSPFMIYVCDTGLVLTGKLLRGEKLLTPHRLHVYQRLVDNNGWSHFRSSAFAAGCAIACSTLGWVWLYGHYLVATAGWLLIVGAYLGAPLASKNQAVP